MRFFCALFLIFCSTAAQAACPHPITTPLSVLPLYNAVQLERLENENLITRICPDNGHACRAAALAPTHEIIPVYAEADSVKGRLGQLVVTYTPGAGLSAVFEHQGQRVDYVPTVFDGDWGYGPWFHATLLESRQGWHKIALPLIGAGWVKLVQAEGLNFADEQTSVYDFAGRPVMLLGMTDGHVQLRDEQPADMPCGLDEIPPLKPFSPERVRIDLFYQDNCELKIQPANKRGC